MGYRGLWVLKALLHEDKLEAKTDLAWRIWTGPGRSTLNQKLNTASRLVTYNRGHEEGTS